MIRRTSGPIVGGLLPIFACCQVPHAAADDPTVQEQREQIRVALRELVLERVRELDRPLTDAEQQNVQAHLDWVDQVAAAIPEGILRSEDGRAWLLESATRGYLADLVVDRRPWKRAPEELKKQYFLAGLATRYYSPQERQKRVESLLALYDEAERMLVDHLTADQVLDWTGAPADAVTRDWFVSRLRKAFASYRQRYRDAGWDAFGVRLLDRLDTVRDWRPIVRDFLEQCGWTDGPVVICEKTERLATRIASTVIRLAGSRFEPELRDHEKAVQAIRRRLVEARQAVEQALETGTQPALRPPWALRDDVFEHGTLVLEHGTVKVQSGLSPSHAPQRRTMAEEDRAPEITSDQPGKPLWPWGRGDPCALSTVWIGSVLREAGIAGQGAVPNWQDRLARACCTVVARHAGPWLDTPEGRSWYEQSVRSIATAFARHLAQGRPPHAFVDRFRAAARLAVAQNRIDPPARLQRARRFATGAQKLWKAFLGRRLHPTGTRQNSTPPAMPPPQRAATTQSPSVPSYAAALARSIFYARAAAVLDDPRWDRDEAWDRPVRQLVADLRPGPQQPHAQTPRDLRPEALQDAEFQQILAEALLWKIASLPPQRPTTERLAPATQPAADRVIPATRAATASRADAGANSPAMASASRPARPDACGLTAADRAAFERLYHQRIAELRRMLRRGT